MRSLVSRLTGRRRGKRSVPVAQRPHPSWPPARDPWAASAETIIIPRVPQQYRPEVNQ